MSKTATSVALYVKGPLCLCRACHRHRTVKYIRFAKHTVTKVARQRIKRDTRKRAHEEDV